MQSWHSSSVFSMIILMSRPQPMTTDVNAPAEAPAIGVFSLKKPFSISELHMPSWYGNSSPPGVKLNPKPRFSSSGCLDQQHRRCAFLSAAAAAAASNANVADGHAAAGAAGAGQLWTTA
eukprot:7092-Heterococcus_DN1.PRE.2